MRLESFLDCLHRICVTILVIFDIIDVDGRGQFEGCAVLTVTDFRIGSTDQELL